MKKIVVILSAILLVVALAVPSFAIQSPPWGYTPFDFAFFVRDTPGRCPS